MGDPSVTPSVENMTYTRLPYEEASTTAEMCHDCQAAESNLAPHHHVHATETHHAAALGGAPTADGQRPIEVSDSLAELAAGLHLHFD